MPTTHKPRYILIVIFCLIALAVVAGIAVAAQRWRQPLSAEAALPTYAPTLSVTVEAEQTGRTESDSSPIPFLTPTDALAGIVLASTPTPMPVGQPTPEPLCGGPAVMTILGIGIDTDDPAYYYGLGDVVRIARVDFTAPRVTVLSLPRDIWVEIPEISEHYAITHGKLNQSYLFGTKGMGYYNGPGQGAGLMALTLAHNFDLYVDRYGTINEATLASIIDSVGGIDITLTQGVDYNPGDDLIDLSAGRHHLNGAQASEFAATRKQDHDLRRIDRQTQVLYALQQKILSPSVLPRLPKLISAFRDSVITDLSPSDLTALTCLVPHITRENLVFATLPGNLLQEDRQYDPHRRVYTWIFRADFEAIRILLGHFQNGSWPVE